MHCLPKLAAYRSTGSFIFDKPKKNKGEKDLCGRRI